MIHLVFNRPNQILKCYAGDGSLWQSFKAEGDAWGAPGYGHDAWMPPGHYLLAEPQTFDHPIDSEGYGQIPVGDVDAATLGGLVKAGKATADGSTASIGGLIAQIGQLAKYDRSAIMIHGGGSNAPQPLADYQKLCKTEGCTRMWNAEWRELAAWLTENASGNTLVYTALGDPVTLTC